jgi:multiple sugar transport system substrate-binding protein
MFWRSTNQPPAGLRRGRRVALAWVLAASTALLAGCGGDTDGSVLNWYVNNPNQAPLAERCAEESGGRYSFNVQLLPNAASGQREQLLRRLAASDSSIDIMSLDPPFMAEFAQADFLRPFTDAERAEFSEGVLDGSLAQAIFEDTMYSAPLFANTQLLWYKKSAAERVGLDPSTEPVTWRELIDAAVESGTTIGVQGRRNESLTVWVNALVESAGGHILDPASEGAAAVDVETAIDSTAGEAAAEIMKEIGTSAASPPALTTAGEEESRAAFQSDEGGFMVNWPYVWAAFDAAIESGDLPADFKDDVGWARYPRVITDRDSAPPIGGIGLSVGAFSTNQDLAVDAIRCLRSEESQKQSFLASGDVAASSAVYDDPEVRDLFPMADIIRDSINDAVPRPISPYYGDVTEAVQRGYHPPNEIDPGTAPGETASVIEGVLRNEQLL